MTTPSKLGYTTEQLKQFYDEGKTVLIQYKSAFELKLSRNAGFYFSPICKTFGIVGFEARGRHRFITPEFFNRIRNI